MRISVLCEKCVRDFLLVYNTDKQYIDTKQLEHSWQIAQFATNVIIVLHNNKTF